MQKQRNDATIRQKEKSGQDITSVNTVLLVVAMDMMGNLSCSCSDIWVWSNVVDQQSRRMLKMTDVDILRATLRAYFCVVGWFILYLKQKCNYFTHQMNSFCLRLQWKESVSTITWWRWWASALTDLCVFPPHSVRRMPSPKVRCFWAARTTATTSTPACLPLPTATAPGNTASP